jgi:hypothetical protein
MAILLKPMAWAADVDCGFLREISGFEPKTFQSVFISHLFSFVKRAVTAISRLKLKY